MTLAALAAALALAAVDAALPDVRLAVVAGNNRGLDGEQPLEFAEQDAIRVHAVLTQLGGVATRRATLLLGGGPEDLLRAVSEMVGQARELSATTPTTVLLYVSAHADEEALHLGGQRLPLADLLERLRGAQAQLRIAVVDACRLPVGARPKGGKPGPEVPVVLDQSARVGGDVLLASTGPGELAQEWSHLRGSLFTHHLLVGLRGAADFDGNARVTLAEAYAYAYRATLARGAEAGLVPQRPTFDFQLAGFGDWVFTRVGGGGAEVVLAEPLAGRFWVTDQRSDVLAELDKRAGEAVRLSLAPGHYRVVRLGGGWAEAADVSLPFGGSRRLEQGSLLRVPAERALAKGSAPLVLRPWRLALAWSVASPGAVGGEAQQRLELGAEHTRGAWSGRLLAGGAWGTIQADGATISERQLQAAASVSYSFPVRLALAGAGLEVRSRVVWQEISQPAEVERLFGQAPAQSALVLGLGPLLSVTLPIRERFSLGAELGTGLEWAPDQQGEVRSRGYALVRVVTGWSI